MRGTTEKKKRKHSTQRRKESRGLGKRQQQPRRDKGNGKTAGSRRNGNNGEAQETRSARGARQKSKGRRGMTAFVDRDVTVEMIRSMREQVKAQADAQRREDYRTLLDFYEGGRSTLQDR